MIYSFKYSLNINQFFFRVSVILSKTDIFREKIDMCPYNNMLLRPR